MGNFGELWGQSKSDLEREILGVIVKDPTLMPRAIETLPDDAFWYGPHLALWKECRRLFDSGTLPTIFNLRSLSADQIGAMVDQCFQDEFEENLAELSEIADRRVFYKLAQVVAKSAETDDIDAMREKLEKGSSLALRPRHLRKNPDIVHIIEEAREAVKVAAASERHVVGISSGYRDIDFLTLGLRKGNMLVLGALPSVGKTQLVFNMIHNLLFRTQDTKFMYFSREMSREMIGKLLISMRAGLPRFDVQLGSVLKRQEASAKFHEACKWWEAQSKRLLVYSEERFTTTDVRVACRQEKPDLCVFDYIQEAGDQVGGRNSGDDYAKINHVSSNLCDIAMESMCSMVAISQLNRKDAQYGRKPSLQSLRGSGNIEANAWSVWLLWRKLAESQKQTNVDDDDDERAPLMDNVARIFVAKVRDGQTGNPKLHFETTTGRMFDMERGRGNG